MRRATRLTGIGVAAVALVGCVDGFRGSNLQLDLTQAMQLQARAFAPPIANELPANTHYAIYAVQQGSAQDRLFELAQFEIHRAVDLSSPCFIDVGEHVPYPGLPVVAFAQRVAVDTGIVNPNNPPATATEEQKTLAASANRRAAYVATILGVDGTPVRAVTSASAATYGPIGTTCPGTGNEFPASTCYDDASNQRRLALCQEAWKANPDLFEGTDRILTAPLNGATRGFVDVPANGGAIPPIGGAQFFVPQALDHVDAFAIYLQTDNATDVGTQVLFGKPTGQTRGVLHVHMTNATNAALTAELAVFTDLGQDNVQF